MQALWESTRALAELDPGVWIHPGHDAGPVHAATLEDQLLHNPALLARSVEEFRTVVERATGRRHAD